jgi:hypothetical protein
MSQEIFETLQTLKPLIFAVLILESLFVSLYFLT